MKSKTVVVLGAFILVTVPSAARAYTYNTCNGVAITDSNSHMWFEFDSTCSMSSGSSQYNAAYHAMGEYDDILPSFVQDVGSSPPGCYWTQGDGISEVAIASPSAIGGNNGETFTESDNSCSFWYQHEHITEADVIVASTLDFGWPDESFVGSNFACQSALPNQQNGQCNIGLGNLTFLHEMGHALGLQHEVGQVIMHNGPPVPYGGGGGGLGDPAALFPDDAAGIRAIYGILNQTSFHNVMAADTHEPFAGADSLVTNNAGGSEPAGWGDIFYGCPGNQLPLWNTAVNNGSFDESFNQNIYANSCPSCISGGWGIGGWSGTYVPSLNIVSSFNTWSVPGGSIPRYTYVWIFLNVDNTDVVHMFGTPNERLWDNFTHYPFVLDLSSPQYCGGL